MGSRFDPPVFKAPQISWGFQGVVTRIHVSRSLVPQLTCTVHLWDTHGGLPREYGKTN